MKTSDLSGTALDYWVAQAAGIGCEIRDGRVMIPEEYGQAWWWNPSSNWGQAGPLIERAWLSLTWTGSNHAGEGPHCSMARGHSFQHGRTRLEAMMRAFVAAKFGESVPDHEEAHATR
jgi:hypothetical protein